MTGVYNLQLVALSLVVATFASYTALELAGRVNQTRGKSAWIWLIGGAFSMGTGIWSMHFIGMLAFRMPITLAYDAATTLLSMMIAIMVSGFVLFLVNRQSMSKRNITIGSILMGLGICAMHYTGMEAMQMFPSIEYHLPVFIASVCIAIAGSFAALWISFQLRSKSFGGAILAKLGGATAMGLAISAMHYTGMAAAEFSPASICRAVDSTNGMKSDTLALIIGIATISVLIITLIVAAVDGYFASHTAKLADSLQASNEQLRSLALYDSLTGLPNRMLLDDRLAQALSRTGRGGKTFTLMYIDLDRFKPVNDSFGHDVGDRLLKMVAQRLASCVRVADTVARIGGDEFVVVLNEIGGAKDAAMVAGKIIDELSRPFFIARNELSISCSIGISIYPEHGKDINTLKANADAAMYQVKRNGRNHYRFFALETSSTLPVMANGGMDAAKG